MSNAVPLQGGLRFTPYVTLSVIKFLAFEQVGHLINTYTVSPLQQLQ